MPHSSSSDMASKRSERALTSSAIPSSSLNCLSAPRDSRFLKEREIILSGLRITLDRRTHSSLEGPCALSLPLMLPCPSSAFRTRPETLSAGTAPSCPFSTVDSMASGPSPASPSLVTSGLAFSLTFEGLCSSPSPGPPFWLSLSSLEGSDPWPLGACADPAEASLPPFSPPPCASSSWSGESLASSRTGGRPTFFF